jgi:hypothetical protein
MLKLAQSASTLLGSQQTCEGGVALLCCCWLVGLGGGGRGGAGGPALGAPVLALPRAAMLVRYRLHGMVYCWSSLSSCTGS